MTKINPDEVNKCKHLIDFHRLIIPVMHVAFLACGFVIKKLKALLVRIGNALLGMAIESTTSASEVNRYIRERARVSEQQKMQLKRFEGKNAIATLSQSVGTLVVFYRDVQLDFTMEMLFDRCHTKNMNRYLKQHIQSCAEKRDCFAKHQPGMAGCGWLQPGRNFLST